MKREFAPDPAEEEAKRLREELAADKERRAKEKVEAGRTRLLRLSRAATSERWRRLWNARRRRASTT